MNKPLPLGPATVAVAGLLAGCMSLTGLDGGSNYACKAPEGVACQSVSGTYASTKGAGDPVEDRRGDAPPATDRLAMGKPGAAVATRNPGEATLLRSAPRILRLWFKPWEDADHDLYDQGYVYVQIDAGRWRVDHIERAIRSAHAPVRPATPSRSTPMPDLQEAGRPAQRPAGADSAFPRAAPARPQQHND